MPPISLAPWREMARKAAQALRRQIADTEQGLASLLNPGRRPQAIPVPLPQRPAPRFPGDRRHYTQSLRSTRVVRSGCVTPVIKTEFGRSAIRPRLTTGTLKSHGYGRSNFSTAQINHAQVAREVYQSISFGIRAGVLNTPYFPPTKGHVSGHVLHGVCSHEISPRTLLEIPLCPSIGIESNGRLSRDVVAEIDEVLCSTPKFLAKLRRDLSKLMRYGNYDYRMINHDTAIQIIFNGRDREEVEHFLKDIDVSCGTVSEEHGVLGTSRHVEDIDWRKLFDMKRPMSKSMESLERFVDDSITNVAVAHQ